MRCKVSNIEGIPDGWELVRVGKPKIGEFFIGGLSCPHQAMDDEHFHGCAIIRRIERPKQYRPFANGAEYMARDSTDIAVDWKDNGHDPCFCAVVSVNNGYVWIAFGSDIERFTWPDAFSRIEFRSKGNATSPFGVEVAS